MEINATIVGQIGFVLAVVFICLTIKFAKGKADNLPLAGFCSLLFNFLFPPAGWFYCYHWNKKKQ